MAYLARVLAQANAWADLADTPAGVENCPLAVLVDVAFPKGGGTSYWAILPDDVATIDAVIAAYAATQEALSAIHMKYISRDDLDRLNIVYQRSSSPTSYKQLGQSAHYDLKINDFRAAFDIAKLMAPTRIFYGISDVARCLVQAINANKIQWKDLKPKLVHQLAINSFLYTSRDAASCASTS